MLIPETDAVWNFLSNRPELGGFVLIGGSALALRIQHRLSEDLDFVWRGTRLPGRALDSLIRTAETEGYRFRPNDDPVALDEFELAGMELRDHQRDFVVNNRVKVSFFTGDSALSKILGSMTEKHCRLATIDELFASKALVSASRSKSRDWFDLYLLMRDHGFTAGDYANVFVRAGIPNQCSLGFSRLCGGKLQANDEGFEDLIDPAPSLDEMTAFFRECRDEWEVQEAENRRRSSRPEPPD